MFPPQNNTPVALYELTRTPQVYLGHFLWDKSWPSVSIFFNRFWVFLKNENDILFKCKAGRALWGRVAVHHLLVCTALWFPFSSFHDLLRHCHISIQQLCVTMLVLLLYLCWCTNHPIGSSSTTFLPWFVPLSCPSIPSPFPSRWWWIGQQRYIFFFSPPLLSNSSLHIFSWSLLQSLLSASMNAKCWHECSCASPTYPFLSLHCILMLLCVYAVACCKI